MLANVYRLHWCGSVQILVLDNRAVKCGVVQFGSNTVTNEPHRAHTVETYFAFFNTLTPDRGRTLMKFQRYGLADIYFAESDGAAVSGFCHLRDLMGDEVRC